MNSPSPPAKKPFPAGAWCVIWIVIGIIGISVIGSIGLTIKIGHPIAIETITLIGFLFFIVVLILGIVGFVNLKEKKRTTMKQVSSVAALPPKKVRSAERRAERKRAKLMAYQHWQEPSGQSNLHPPTLQPVAQRATSVPSPPVNQTVPAPAPQQAVVTQSASTAPVVTPTKHLPNVYMPQTAQTVVVQEDLKRIAVQIVDDIRPASVKGKTPKKAGAPVETTAEPLPFDEATEKEVGVQEQKFTCVVHKGPITGANYLCSKCGTFYCMNCAIALKKNGEKCWTCGSDLAVDLPEE